MAKEQSFTSITLDRDGTNHRYVLKVNGKSFASINFEPGNSDILNIIVGKDEFEQKGIRVNEWKQSYGQLELYLSGFGGKDVETIERP